MYNKLQQVFDRALEQASSGKGKERHANGLPFEKQRMQGISDLLDNVDGMAFQVIKKVLEARQLPTVEHQVAELLGAINYAAGMIVFLEKGNLEHKEWGDYDDLCREIQGDKSVEIVITEDRLAELQRSVEDLEKLNREIDEHLEEDKPQRFHDDFPEFCAQGVEAINQARRKAMDYAPTATKKLKNIPLVGFFIPGDPECKAVLNADADPSVHKTMRRRIAAIHRIDPLDVVTAPI